MKIEEIKKIYSPIIKSVYIDNIISRKNRKIILQFLFLSILLLIFTEILEKYGYIKSYINYTGILLIIMSIYIKFFCINLYLNNRYFLEIDQMSNLHHGNRFFKGSYLLSEILVKTSNKNPISGLVLSNTGLFIWQRLGIDIKEVLDFYITQKDLINENIKDFDIKNPLTSFVVSIFDTNEKLREFLFSKSTTRDDLIKTLYLIEKDDNEYRRSQNFWSKENLSKIPKIGTDWSYSKAFTLEKYAILVENYQDTLENNEDEEKIVSQMETILSKKWQSNVLLLGNDPIIKMDLVKDLGRKIISDQISHELKNKKIYLLQINLLLSEGKDKYQFEDIIINILNEIIVATDIILVIEDLPSFIISARNIGTDIVSLLDPYLDSKIQIIATSPKQTFHQVIEKEASLIEHFEIVKYDNKEISILDFIMDKSRSIESEYGIFFTWPAIKSLDENINRFFIDQSLIDKSIDILTEIPIYCHNNNKNTVLKEDVEKIISMKVGIPIGIPEKEEADKLLNLKESMEKRIVGQKEAVKAISETMLRQRSGIGNKNKPLGSFLFIGPTGVGKTETAKTLASIFFNGEENMTRFDMSEFSSSDSIKNMIGSFENSKNGILANKITENPYSVLLLDEFEKASKEVHNLFLQIIDEGFFSDHSGKRINCKNVIIIATSNAGSDFIWEIIEKNENLNDKKQTIIDKIIESGIFSPELLNRFDDIILFHPLSENDVKNISKILLSKTALNLQNKGIKLEIDDTLINFVAEKGFDRQFGARPLKRIIQESVEKIIAEKIISRKIRGGEKIRFNREELENSLK